MSVNRVMLVGHLGTDPEVRYTSNGNPVLNFRMATTDRWIGRDGQRQERTEWHRIQHWGKTVTQLERMLRKGSRVYVEGRIQTREYEAHGEKRYVTEVVADRVFCLDRKPRDGGTHAA